MNNINKLPPFKRFCITLGNLPTSYMNSMSYYECLMWLCKYLQEQVIPTVNENAEAVNELINWFNTLDVQDEIDNKLDEMAESGELQEIVASYLNSKAIFGFDNVASMKSSSNLIDGSYAKTLGYYNRNDKGGALYRIRQITNSDVVDEMTIIALNDVSLVAELIVTSEINIKQLGAKNDNTTDISNVLTKVFTLSADTIIIPSGNYKVNSRIELNEVVNKNIKCFGTLNFTSSATKDDSCFQLIECNNLTFDGFTLSSTRDKTGFAPSGHTRVTSYSSNRNGFKLLKCENINILNSNFNNMEDDVRITKRESDESNANLNKNININGMYSRNSSNSIYAQNITNLYIENADIKSAIDLGSGDHILYINEYSKNINFNNSTIEAGDLNLGVLLDCREYHFETNEAAPVDFYSNNLNAKGISVYSAQAITKGYFNNLNASLISAGTTNQTIFAVIGNTETEINNSHLNTIKQIFAHNSGTPKILIQNSILYGDSDKPLFDLGTSGNPNVILKNNKITTNSRILDIATALSNTYVEINSCEIYTSSNYIIASRNPSGNNIIRILNSYFKNTYDSSSNFSYNGSGNNMTGYEILSSYLNGFTNVAANTANCLSVNSYLNNNLITIS